MMHERFRWYGKRAIMGRDTLATQRALQRKQESLRSVLGLLPVFP
jgi:hypothetical protein